MKYPKECPAFEVVSTVYHHGFQIGDIVEGYIREDGTLTVYSATPLGTPWGAYYTDDSTPNIVLLPLTQAARDMLAEFTS